MEYTREMWGAVKWNQGHGFNIFSNNGLVASVPLATGLKHTMLEAEANANLICQAVNACIELNPQNPLAVAEGIKDVVQVLTWVQEDMDSGRSCVSTRSAVHQVLAKINKDNSPLTP